MAGTLTLAPHLLVLAKREKEESRPLWSAKLHVGQDCRAELRVWAPLASLQMQYTFIYQALLEYYLYGDTELDVSSLEKHLQTMHGTTTHFDKIGLEEEFRVSTADPPLHPGISSQGHEENR